MSSAYISAELRQQVAERAYFVCEYCLIHSDDTHFGCQIDHIISEKHAGLTEPENLAYACAFCNRFKGSDVGSIDWETDAFVRFYNSRTDRWRGHFEWQGIRIIPTSAIGRVTERILQLNHIDRLIERQELVISNRHPTSGAIAYLETAREE
jgi:hypothetical protein